MVNTDKKITVLLTDANEAPEILFDTDAGGRATKEIKREVNEFSGILIASTPCTPCIENGPSLFRNVLNHNRD